MTLLPIQEEQQTCLAQAVADLGAYLQEPLALRIIDMLQQSSARHIYLVGGAPRDAVASRLLGRSIPATDLDIVVDSVSTSSLAAFFDDMGLLPNAHGGIHVPASQNSRGLDIWLLNQSPKLLEYGLEPTINNLLSTFIIDLNSIAYDICCDQIIASPACLASLRLRRVGLIPNRPTGDPVVASTRALVLAARTSFSLSEGLVRLIRHHASWERIDDFLTQRKLDRYRSAIQVLLRTVGFKTRMESMTEDRLGASIFGSDAL